MPSFLMTATLEPPSRGALTTTYLVLQTVATTLPRVLTHVHTRLPTLCDGVQDALDGLWKAHQTLGGEPYPQARMQHLLIVFGTTLTRFMQVGAINSQQ